MLDFNKLMAQIDQVGDESLSDSLDEHETVINAQEAYDQAKAAPEQFEQRLDASRATVLWPLAHPLEHIGNSYAVEPQTDPVTVVAVDGSQIMPSHHEVHSCYLLNVGLAAVTYGAKHAAILESLPQLYHRPEDLYPLVDRRRMHIDELYVSLERSLLELTKLLERAMQMQERGAPVVALYDGSLIAWSAEKLPPAFQENYNERMAATLDHFQRAAVPVIGYLSHSRSSDLINSLRVSICPYETSRCRDYCSHLNEEEFPCSKIWPLSDRQLLHGRLDMHKRSAAFVSGSPVVKSMPGPHKICFTYVNTGFEIARLEFPHWLFTEQKLFKGALSTVLAQSQKGKGYPICLSEAHHLAVIRGGDRERFFALMTQHLVGLGMPRVRVSPKESKKRIGFV